MQQVVSCFKQAYYGVTRSVLLHATIVSHILFFSNSLCKLYEIDRLHETYGIGRLHGQALCVLHGACNVPYCINTPLKISGIRASLTMACAFQFSLYFAYSSIILLQRKLSLLLQKSISICIIAEDLNCH